MTITEANAVNTVLNVLLALGIHDADSDTVDAAALLADKANAALHAGLTGDRVREALA